MKRISTLLLAGAMFLGSLGAAQAMEVKVKGVYDFTFGWGANTDFVRDQARSGDRDERDDFIARQRVRTQINFVTSEFLQGVLMFEIGDIEWGRGGKMGQGSGGDLGADGVNVETKRAYIDWLVPNTDLAIRMGIQGLALPSATGFGSPVFDDDVAAITASYQFNEMVGLTAFWARPFDDRSFDGGNERKLDDETDMFGVILPVAGDGWAVTPWTVLANVGSQSGIAEFMFEDGQGYQDVNGGEYATHSADKSLGWWVGSGFELTLWDPLTFAADVAYGQIKNMDGVFGIKDADLDISGWFVDARIDYKMDWATAGLFGWWASGDSRKDQKNGDVGRLPSISPAGFAPTTFGFDGAYSIGDGATVAATGTGTWGIGAQLADMSFVEDLQHTLRVAYYRGTNAFEGADERNAAFSSPAKYAADTIYMTKEDNAWEVNLDSNYQIYENLAAVVELGYVHLNLDEDHYQYGDRDNAWKAQVSFSYEF